jgi:hypothetical protein
MSEYVKEYIQEHDKPAAARLEYGIDLARELSASGDSIESVSAVVPSSDTDDAGLTAVTLDDVECDYSLETPSPLFEDAAAVQSNGTKAFVFVQGGTKGKCYLLEIRAKGESERVYVERILLHVT